MSEQIINAGPPAASLSSNGAERLQQQTKHKSASRDSALDALRGMAVLLMVAAGLMPYEANQSLPAWMYHAQEPPPSHNFNPRLPGLTWVDLVFPTFLFCMGAAIPLAYSRRLKEENGLLKSLGVTAHRAAALVWFAYYRNYLMPYHIEVTAKIKLFGWTVNQTASVLGLLGFLLLFPMFTRLPDAWSILVKIGVRLIGFGGGLLLLWSICQHAKKPFSFGDTDIILMVLADMAFFGALIWLCTRDRPLIRLGVLPILFASRMASDSNGWVKELYNLSHVPYLNLSFDWFFQFDFLKYLLIVIPGTIAGDLLVNWLREPLSSPAAPSMSQELQTPLATPLLALTREPEGEGLNASWAGAAILTALLVILVLAGLESRQLLPVTLGAWVLCGVICGLTRDPIDPTQRLVHHLVRWGSYFIVLGLVFEPFQGGIKKDHATYSYLCLTPGLAFMLLAGLIVLTALYRLRRPVGLLVDMGRNPMVGYVGMDSLLLPLITLTPLDDLLGKLFTTPWLIALRALLQTLLLGYFVRLCNRLHLTWRT